MNIRSPKPWDTKHGVTQYYRFTVDMFFVLDFFISLMCGKTTVLIICIHKRVKSIVFAVSIKFCDESGLAIKNFFNVFSVLRNYLSFEKGCGPSFEQTWIPFTQVCFVPSWNLSSGSGYDGGVRIISIHKTLWCYDNEVLGRQLSLCHVFFKIAYIQNFLYIARQKWVTGSDVWSIIHVNTSNIVYLFCLNGTKIFPHRWDFLILHGYSW